MPISRGRGQYTYMMINDQSIFKSPSTIAQSTVAIAAPPSTSIVWNDKNTIMMIYFLRHGPVGGIMVECVTSVWPPDVDTDNVTWIMRRWGSCYFHWSREHLLVLLCLQLCACWAVTAVAYQSVFNLNLLFPYFLCLLIWFPYFNVCRYLVCFESWQ